MNAIDAVTALPHEAIVPEKKLQAQRLVELLPDEALFRSTDGETTYATVPIREHRETWHIRSKGFQRWLVGSFYLIEGRPPSKQALTDALGTLEARAQFGGHIHEVHVRVAGHHGAVYVDLVNATWDVVEVTATGWRITRDPPVKFLRSRGMQALPNPVPGGSLSELRPFVNVRDDAQWALFVAWLVATLNPDGPHPMLALSSEHGSGKTTLSEVARRLVDPNRAMLRAEPRDVRDVMIAATNSWLVAFDNLSALSPWLSDCLCRLATGGAFSTRALYTDADEMIFSAQRPTLLNGIDDVVTRGDLLDRAILLDLPPIAEERRQPAREFWRAFEAARPRILGALLDAVSQALRRAPLVRLPRLPRMADFAIWVTAAAPALGWPDDYFLSVYTANRDQAHELALDVSPVAAAIRTLADRGAWSGTAADLLESLAGLVDETTRRARTWPTTPRNLGGEVRRLAPNLRSVGVALDFTREARAGRRRIITIKNVGVSDRPHRPHRPLANGDARLEMDDHSDTSSAPGDRSVTVDAAAASVDASASRPSTRNGAPDRRLDDVDDVDAAILDQSTRHGHGERNGTEPPRCDGTSPRAFVCARCGGPGYADAAAPEQKPRHLAPG